MEENLKIPRHIGFIMDGNGRWAKKLNKPRNYGHANGAERVKEVVEGCFEYGVECVSLYAFSTENWQRPKEEVDKILLILENFLKKYSKTLIENKIRLLVSGDISALPKALEKTILEKMEKTAIFKGRTLNIAINYGGRQEIVNAVNKIIESGITQIDEKTFNNYLYTKDLPDIDLMVRTSGEQRISNFFPWQLCYAELYFTEVLWPDFDKEQLKNALIWYSKRERRFGKI